MSNSKLLGILSWFGAALLVGFQGISKIMESEGDFMEKTLEKAMDGRLMDFAEGLPFHLFRKGAMVILDTPIYILLIISGAIFFLFNKVTGKD